VSIEHKLGIHASPTCIMSFGDNDDCVGWMIGGEGGGMRAMFTMMNNARLNVGLQGVSIAERATQAAVAYAATRVQGVRAGWARRESVPIIQHPDVRRMLLRMKALTQAARALTYYAAGQVDRATLGDREAQMRADLLTPLVKAYGTTSAAKWRALACRSMAGWASSRRPAPPSIIETPASRRSTKAPTASRRPTSLAASSGWRGRGAGPLARRDGADAAGKRFAPAWARAVGWRTLAGAEVDDRLAPSTRPHHARDGDAGGSSSAS
jgi:hypothetical protein